MTARITLAGGSSIANTSRAWGTASANAKAATTDTTIVRRQRVHGRASTARTQAPTENSTIVAVVRSCAAVVPTVVVATAYAVNVSVAATIPAGAANRMTRPTKLPPRRTQARLS